MGSRTALLIGAGVVFLTAIILFAVSFDSLAPTEIGLKYNGNLKSVSSRVYNNGRYFLGVGLKFIKFETNLQLVEFRGNGEFGALRAWSREGQLVIMDISFMYRVDRLTVYQLYRRYGQSFDAVVRKEAVEAIKSVSIQFETSAFFVQRREIGRQMKAELTRRLALDFVVVELFNLRSIDLPDRFENKIVLKVVQAQEIKTAINKQLTAEQRANITVIQGDAVANVSVNLGNAEAERTRIVEEARSTRFELLRTQEAESYGALQSVLGLNDTSLLRYRWGQIAQDVASTRNDVNFVVGFESPIVRVQA